MLERFEKAIIYVKTEKEVKTMSEKKKKQFVRVVCLILAILLVGSMFVGVISCN